jgi:Fe-S-cluster containining protein
MHDDEFAEMVRQASARPEVRRAVGELYASVQREVEARRPRCEISGRCCRFEEYGHRLFVTTMELAAFAHDLDQAREFGRLPATAEWNGTGCPFQVAKLCGVHSIRPFGCRMFFCDATATDWQNQTYERFHADLRRLHDAMAVPYRYIEWRAALRALGIPEVPPSTPTEAAVRSALSSPPESF